MRKKKLEKTEETVKPEPQKELIAPLELDLGRDDLNRLVAKLNEVIKDRNESK